MSRMTTNGIPIARARRRKQRRVEVESEPSTRYSSSQLDKMAAGWSTRAS